MEKCVCGNDLTWPFICRCSGCVADGSGGVSVLLVNSWDNRWEGHPLHPEDAQQLALESQP